MKKKKKKGKEKKCSHDFVVTMLMLVRPTQKCVTFGMAVVCYVERPRTWSYTISKRVLRQLQQLEGTESIPYHASTHQF